jgi:L-alanine-DL-glutamate epimerase-like enolase superfamily enzyme
VTDVIERIETYCLDLPYRKAVQFASVKEAVGRYLLLRVVTRDGAEGLAECVCRPAQSGETPAMLAAVISDFYAPVLKGADPLDHNRLLGAIGRVKGQRTAFALVDVALWDIKGKLLGQPVWRLLGGGPARPVPLAWIVHGNSTREQVKEAVEAIEKRGFAALKLKAWKRSRADVEMVRAVRKAVGDSRIVWVDCNGSYTETEARTVLPELAPYGISFIEEPCRFPDQARMARLASQLPIALLGDQTCTSLGAVQNLIRLGAVGAVSVKLRRTGITESLKVIALAEAAGLPVVIGTDSESRIGAMPRLHLHAAIPSLAPWPAETHFFQKLADDAYSGSFVLKDGAVTPSDAPGFGARLDKKKLAKYRAR